MSENKNLKIINCCPHTVSVFEGSVYDPASGKSKGGKEILRFPASGIVASARSSVEALPSMEIDGVAVPTCKRNFAKVSELPGEENHLYIVSSVYAQATKELGGNVENLLTPYGTVVNECGAIVGCTGLIRYA